MIPLPVAWVAQDSGNTNQISRLKNAGFRSAALSLAFTNQNAVDEYRKANIFVIAEGVLGPASTLPAGVQALCAQVETTFQLQATVAAFNAGLGHGLPLAIGTTYGGLDVKGTWSNTLAHFKEIERVFIECYKDDDPVHAQIPRMLNQGVEYGIPGELLIALCGTYRQELPKDYIGLTPNNYGGIYQISQTRDSELDEWAKFNALLTQPPVPVPPPPDPKVTRAAASKDLHVWLDYWLAQGKPQHKSINRIADRILKLTDAQALDFDEDLVIAELDRVGSPRS